MADEAENAGASGDFGVLGGLPAETAEMFPDEANGAAPFARLAPRSKGRPQGSANRRTLAMRDHYLRRGYAHPMLWMGEVLSRPVAELALELECSKLEALEIQRKVAGDLAPYLESRMPTQIKPADDEGLPVLIVGEIRAARASGALPEGAIAIDDELADAIEENQRVGRREGAKSHGE